MYDQSLKWLEELTWDWFENLKKLLAAEFKGLKVDETAFKNQNIWEEYIRKVQTIVGSMFSTEWELTIQNL